MRPPTPLPAPKGVYYCPPTRETIETYARAVCEELGGAYVEDEVMRGFTAFVKVAVAIQAGHLNGRGEPPVSPGAS